MDSNKITVVSGRGIPVRGNDIDTDRIIPARYLKEITFSGMGEYPFFDERFDDNGGLKEHPFNREELQGAAILFVNENFGCGSSREHAPQALMRWGIPVLTASASLLASFQDLAEKNPSTRFIIDIEGKSISWKDETAELNISEAGRMSLVNGTWDSTSLLLDNLEQTRKTVSTLPYMGWN